MRPTPLDSWVSWELVRVQRREQHADLHVRSPDVISIEKSGEHFRLLYDVKGRFAIHRITAEEATYKLLKVKKVQLGAKGVPFIVTHDGRTIRYPDPAIKVNDTVKFDLVEQKIVDHIKFEAGNLVMATGGRNMGRSGVIVHRERHLGGFDIVRLTLPSGRWLLLSKADPRLPATTDPRP
jgi:ribosomal protein S4E